MDNQHSRLLFRANTMLNGPSAPCDEHEQLPSLRVRGQTGDSTAVPFRLPFLLLGRHPRCKVRLKHPDVSMRHAIAIRFAAATFLLDLDSRTGIHWMDESNHSGWLSDTDAATLAKFTVSSADTSSSNDLELPDPTREFVGAVDQIPDVTLTFIDGPLQGTEYRIKRTITLIGRGPKCKVRLRDDVDISQIHACFLLDERGLFLIDTLSRLGTSVDGQSVRHAELCEGQQVQIGKHRMQVARCRPRLFKNTEAPADCGNHESTTGNDHPEYALVQSLRSLRDLPESERNDPVDELLSAGKISSWQSKKIRRKDPTRLILDKRFLMMEPVGRGGMGTVYRAFDLETGEAVALKTPETRVSNPERRFARFRREMSISSSLRHPHIVRMRDVGHDLRFLVFDFVKGKPLSRLIAEHGSQDPTFVAQWVSEVADALAYARQKGVIHRDIKPENIMITEQNSAMLLDLGLARLSEDFRIENGNGDDQVALTQVGFTVGTIDFMSPEQAAAADKTDSRSDIYSLGCTMYAALSGHPPFRARSPLEVARQHLQEPLPPIPDLQRDLARIVERALEKRPADRFQTPEELRDSLEQWLKQPDASSY